MSPDEKRRSLRTRPEYLVFRIGVVLSVLWLAGLGLLQAFSPETGGALVKMTGLTPFFGRAVGIGTAIESGLAWSAIAAATATIEILIVLVLYPLAVFSCEKLARARFFGGALDAAVRAAHRHRPRVARYGIPGLLLFVWFPFWSTGPLVGAVIGYFLGLRVWVNLTVVTVGTVLAGISWTLLFRQLHAAAAGFSRVLPLVFAAIIVGVAIYLRVRTHLRKRRHEKGEDRGEDSPPPPA